MYIEFFGKAFPHAVGEFCQRRKLTSHFISFFLTDYVYEKDGELVHGRGGDMLIIPEGEFVYHGPTPEMKEGFVNDWLYVAGEDFINEVMRLELPVGKPFSVGGERHLARFIEKAERERAYAEEGHERMTELFLSEALIKIARSYKRGEGRDATAKITALRGELAAEPKKNWTLSEMAERCGYSESRFSALYKTVYGLSPVADLIGIRLEQAKFLLLYSNKPISEIAFEVGFSTVFYFSNYFKKYEGVSPKTYRESGENKQNDRLPTKI